MEEATMTKRKRGRPSKVKTTEQKIMEGNHWDRTDIQKKQSLGLVYLSMSEEPVSLDIKNKFLKQIKETPIEDFDHQGWSKYKEILALVSKD